MNVRCLAGIVGLVALAARVPSPATGPRGWDAACLVFRPAAASRANGASPQAGITGLIGIIGTFPLETALLRRELKESKELPLLGLSVHIGLLRGRRVVLMTSGVGSTNSGAGAALLIERFHPAIVILHGVAGGVGGAQPNFIVLGDRVINYGFALLDDTAYQPWQTYQPSFNIRNPLYFPADRRLLAAAQAAAGRVRLKPVTYDNGGSPQVFDPQVVTGVIASSDVFSTNVSANDAEQQQTGALALEEEGASVAQICYQQGVPYLAVRAISNLADANGFAVFEALKRATAENGQRLVLEMVGRL